MAHRVRRDVACVEAGVALGGMRNRDLQAFVDIGACHLASIAVGHQGRLAPQ